jgi:hypothetical protein
MAPTEVHGPIDFLLLEFQGKEFKGEVASAIMDLVDQGIVRIFDLLVVVKEADGTVSGINIEDLSADSLGGFEVFAGARSGLVGDDDVSEVGAALEPGTIAALIVYENTWAIPFVRAARAVGGEVVASARIPAQDVMDALDAMEAGN